ncbi:MAG: hypothetical protein HW412_1424, partial [Bacteroidetes bacterium]|nr:hypothetical protein [Bacteroidota bacterium]
PVATDADAIHGAVTKAAPQEPQPDPSLITFDQKVVYYADADVAQIMHAVGAIKFSIDQVPIMSDELYDVQLSVKGALSSDSEDGAAWSFGGSSTERIRIFNGKKVRFEKRFTVYGAKVPTLLTMGFTLTETSLSLASISLSVSKKGPVPVSHDDVR